jgi:hypothetical protein
MWQKPLVGATEVPAELYSSWQPYVNQSCEGLMESDDAAA